MRNGRDLTNRRLARIITTDSPAKVDFKQLRELYVQSTWKEKKEAEVPAAQGWSSYPADGSSVPDASLMTGAPASNGTPRARRI